MLKRILSATLAAMIASCAFAVPFDNTSGGSAVCTVGTAGDFPTLSAAIANFNSVVGDINRPWTLEIQNSTTETTNPMMANTFGAGGSVTIKPAAGTQPVVTFTIVGSTATQPGFWAHFGIGVNDCFLTTDVVTYNGRVSGPYNDSYNHRPSNNNYVIDGSNTVGGTTRDLTFKASLASGINNLFGVVGNNDGVVIKNANLIFWDTSGSAAAIRYATMNVGTLGDLSPDNCVLENCYLDTNKQAAGTQTFNGFGVTVGNAQGTMTAGVAIQNLQILGNEVQCRQRAFFVNPIKSFTIKGNNINIGDPLMTGGYLQVAFFHLGNNGATGAVCNIEDNITSVTEVGGTGSGFGINYCSTDRSDTTYNIKNNIFRSPTITNAAAATDGAIKVFMCTNGSSNYNIEHNSVDLADQPKLTGATSATISILNTAAAFDTGSLTVKNNILRFGETGALAYACYLTSTVKTVFEGNDIFAAGTAKLAHIAQIDTNVTSFAAWQALGFDSNASGAQSIDPKATTPGAWDANLHFTGRPIQMRGVIPTVATDFDGDTRSLTEAYPGADEGPTPLPVSMSSFTID